MIGTNVRAGTEIKVTTERPSLDINLSELNKGSWVIFQLPGFTTAASGRQEDSLDALRKAGETSYFKDYGCPVGQGGRQRGWRQRPLWWWPGAGWPGP